MPASRAASARLIPLSVFAIASRRKDGAPLSFAGRQERWQDRAAV